MTFAFGSNQRIKDSNIFEKAFRNKALTNKWFTIHLIDSNQKFARLGMVVSKRTIPKSVNRNYAKRLIRESFRLNVNLFPSLDFVVRLRRKLTEDKISEAREALLNLMLSAKKI